MRRCWIISILAVCAVGSACAAVDDTVPVPTPMLGVWRTDDIEYRGRFLEFRPTSIWIGTASGPGNRTRYTILRVHQTRDSLGLLYTIDYMDVEGEDYNISLYFDEFGAGPIARAFYAYDGSQGTLRLRNKQQIEWRKTRH